MNLKTNIANSNNYGEKRDLSNIKYIVIHYTANDGDTDEANANYFHNNIVNASAHYFVDDDSVTQSVYDNYVAWSVGGSKYASCSYSGGGKFYGLCTNANSISVELCDTVKNGKSDFTESTIANAVEIVRTLMKKYNIDIAHVIRHFDVVGKTCPKPFVDYVSQWNNFKERLVDDEVIESSKIKINGKYYNVSRILKNDTNYIKIRDLEQAGFTISSEGNIAVLNYNK